MLLNENMSRQQVENVLIQEYYELLTLSKNLSEQHLQDLQKNADWMNIVEELISLGSIDVSDLYVIMSLGLVTLMNVFELAEIDSEGLENIYELMESGELPISTLFGFRTQIDVSDPERLHVFSS